MQKKFKTGKTVIFYDDRIIQKKEIIAIVDFIRKTKMPRFIECSEGEIEIYEPKKQQYRFFTNADSLEKKSLKKIRMHEKIWYLMKKKKEF